MNSLFLRLGHALASATAFLGFRTAPAPPRPEEISAWYHVTFDADAIHRDVRPPGRAPWSDTLPWADITRVVFEATDYLFSDNIHLFTDDRPEAWTIPMEAEGGDALWSEVLRRHLFPYELSIDAMASPGGLFIWPDPSADA